MVMNMRKNKKIYFLLFIVGLLIPMSGDIAFAECPNGGINCSLGFNGSDQGENPSYNPTVDNNKQFGSSDSFTTIRIGDAVAYSFADETDRQAAINAGKCSGNCFLDSDIGLIQAYNGTKPTDEHGDNYRNAITNVKNGYTSDGVHLNTDNPIYEFYIQSAYEQLGLGTSDIYNGMSTKEAVEYYMYENNGTGFNMEFEPSGIITNSRTGETYFVNEQFIKENPEIYNQMVNDSWGVYGYTWSKMLCSNGNFGDGVCGFTDEGSIERLPNSGDPECENPPCNRVDDWVCEGDYCNIQPDKAECEVPVIPFVKIPPKPTPTGISGGGSCGTTYRKTSYDTNESTACGYVSILTTKSVSIPLPDIQGKTFYAGSKLNWSFYPATVTISKQIFDTSELDNRIGEQQVIIQRLEAEIGCLQKNIADYERLKGEAQAKAGDSCRLAQTSCGTEYGKCMTQCCKCDPETTDCTNYVCNTSSCNCGSCANACDTIYDSLKTTLDTYDKEIESLTKKIEDIRTGPMMTAAKDELERLKNCSNEMNSYSPSSTTSPVLYGTPVMDLANGYSQVSDTIKAIEKNSGRLLTEKEIMVYENKNLLLSNDSDFVIPYSVEDGTKGTLSTYVSDATGFVGLNYTCNFDVKNALLGRNGIELIYRPISLTNPFPDIKNGSNEYRVMGSNWNVSFAESVIKNNRGVNTYEVYNLQPIYTITLTPSDIKKIREYNKKHSFTDFEMECQSNGYKCSSNFIWNDFSDIVDFSNSCAQKGDWSKCYLSV